MPHLTSISWTAWLLTIVMQPALVALMIYKKVWRRWLSLFCFLAWNSVGSIVLLAITLSIRQPFLRSHLYFWTYWAVAFTSDLLEVWMMIQIGCEMAGVSPRIRRCIRGSIWTLAVIDGAGAWLMTSCSHLPAWGRISRIVLDIDKAVSLAWLATFMLMVLLWEFLGIRDFSSTRFISVGYAIFAMSATCASWLLGFGGSPLIVSNVHEVLDILALATWAYAFHKSHDFSPALTPEQLERFARSLQACVDTIQQRKNQPIP